MFEVYAQKGPSMPGSDKQHDVRFEGLIALLSRIPAVVSRQGPVSGFGSGVGADGTWWVKFAIDINHPLAWSTVQELGHLPNYLDPTERLPTVFIPVSPPPYLNGGPEFLSWVIECHSGDFDPDKARAVLVERLPNPADDLTQWQVATDSGT